MAFRFQFEPQVVHALESCPASLRLRLQGELGALVGWAGAGSIPVPGPGREGALRLASGFQVRYRLEPHAGLLRVTTLRPLSVVRSPAS